MFKPVIFVALLSLFLCSCVTENPSRSELPASVTMNQDAGRGDLLIVTLRLANGQELPFVVDTGSPVTLLDKSFEPQLGKRLDNTLFWNFGVSQVAGVYAAPTLYMGKTPLLTGTNIGTFDYRKLANPPKHPVEGILGMDTLKYYCIQLDFKKGKMRFLDHAPMDKINWGRPFPLTDIGDGCCIINENLTGTKDLGSLIDTGCDNDGWLTTLLFQEWTNQTIAPIHGEVHSPKGTLGGETYRELDLRDLGVSMDDPHTRGNGIGLHVLSRDLVTFDFPDKTMYLKHISDWPSADKKVVSAGKSAAKSAIKFLSLLVYYNKLPGMYPLDDVRSTSYEFRHRDSPYLDMVTYDIRVNGYSTLNHYTVIRTSKYGSWKLQKAWRTDKNDRPDKEYPVP